MSSQTRSFTTLTAAIALAACAGTTHAQIFDNGDPSQGFGVTVLSERDSFNQVADDFVLPADANNAISQVRWWGTGEGQQFSMRIFSDQNTSPSSTPLFTVDLGTVVGTVSPFSNGGTDVFEYNASFDLIGLGPGFFELSIVETTAGNDWFWSASQEDGFEGESWRRANDAANWETGNFQFAFVLDVPEPGTGALFALGALAVTRRRRQR